MALVESRVNLFLCLTVKHNENHAYAVALHMMAYNFAGIHGTIKCSPAMAVACPSGFGTSTIL